MGEGLATAIGWRCCDTDAMIVAREHESIATIFERRGEPHFRRLETTIVKQILSGNEQSIVATGGGLPAIDGMMTILRNGGTTIYLRASIDELWNRLTVDPEELEKRPLLYRKGRVGLEQMVSSRERVYNSAEIIIDTDGRSADETISKTREILIERKVI